MVVDAELALQRYLHVLQYRQLWEHRRYLEGTHDAAARGPGRFLLRDVIPVEQDAALRRDVELGEQVEYRRLSCAIGADQRVNRAAPDFQIHVAHGNEAPELLGEFLRLENDVLGHAEGRMNE